MQMLSIRVTLAIALLAAAGAPAGAEELPTIAEKTAAMVKRDGFVPLFWDGEEGRLYIEVEDGAEQMIYLESLATGIGSNDIGLDRTQVGGERIVYFQRIGPRVLMVQPNLRFRAGSNNLYEHLAVQESFAQSVLWGFPLAAVDGDRWLLDATDFVLRDAHDVIGTLKATGQGSFELDASRSALYLPRTRSFPRNTEIEATLTFTGDEPGGWVTEVTPTPGAITVRQRHSFIALPPLGFQRRPSRPDAGYFGISYYDYAAPIGAPLRKRFIARHRLEKKDPAAAVSDAVEPIVYYLDRGVPEPVRSALLDGARWWAAAFEAAGYRDAFRVEMLPDGADPLDIRYNVIQWVHRATRGWSYGTGVIDPRTGEIIKGQVSLGSLRVRQDYLLAEGLLAPYATGDEEPTAALAMALARIRQLSAHEVGHTLGLAHNYIASTQGRASVMDYPHPLATLAADGSIDLSDAYAVGAGAWDHVAIAYGYQDFPAGTDEAAALDLLLVEAERDGLTFLTDQDARPRGGAHPLAHLWDNGADPVAELDQMMRVRRAALERFGERVLRRGAPLALMEEALVPIYLRHRFQVEAVAKAIAGRTYSYARRGDGRQPPRSVPPRDQKRALGALLETIESEQLTLPAAVLDNLPPRPFTYPSHREMFPRYTGLVPDAITPAVVAADMTVSMILQPERAARLVEQHALDRRLPSLEQVIDKLIDSTFGERPSDGYQAEVNRAVERVVVDQLIGLAGTAPMPQVRAVSAWRLDRLRQRLDRDADRMEEADRAHYFLLAADIGRFLVRDLGAVAPPESPAPPPGSPIGASDEGR